MLRPIPCTARELGTVLDLSDRRISELTRVGILHKPYNLSTSVRQYIRFLRSNRGTLTNERSRLTKAKADLAELAYRVRQGEFVLRDSVEKEVFALSRRVRENFLNLPSRTDALVAAESDQQKCFAILEKEVRQILEGLSTALQPGAA